MKVLQWIGALARRCGYCSDDRHAVMIYVAAQFIYTYLLDTWTNFLSMLCSIPQMLGPDELRYDLLRSLLYLHMQPPLLNGLYGLVIKLAPGEAEFNRVMGCIQFILGIYAVACIDRTMRLFLVRRGLRIVMLLWLCFFPTFIVFAHEGYTTFFEFGFCAFAMYRIALLIKGGRWTFESGCTLFLLFSVLGLLRAQWHPVMFALLLVCCPKGARFSFTLGAFAGMVPLLLVFLKNLVLFGFFGVSSWGWGNLAGVVWPMLSNEELAELRENEHLSAATPAVLLLDRARTIRQEWQQRGEASPTIDHPVLSEKKSCSHGEGENYNAQSEVEAGKEDKKLALAILSHYHHRYAAKLYGKLATRDFIPSLASQHVFHLGLVREFDTGYPNLPEWMKDALGNGSFLLYAITPALAFALAEMPHGYMHRYRAFVLITLFIAIFMFALSCAWNYGEEERMRWGEESIYFVIFAMTVEALMEIFHTLMAYRRMNRGF